MWAFHKSESRRNSASIVELRRAEKLVVSRDADLQKSPGLRRANSCKETDTPPPKPHARPPYPDYYESDFKAIGRRVGSDSEIKPHKNRLLNFIMNNSSNNVKKYEQSGFSSLNYPVNYFAEERHVKDLRSADSCPTIPGQNDEESERKSRHSSYSSRDHSLTDIPEDSKEKRTTFNQEDTPLFLPNDTCSISSYHSSDHFFKVRNSYLFVKYILSENENSHKMISFTKEPNTVYNQVYSRLHVDT